ncbi:MAG: SDR family NAD(P)-dependent oxidoreductase, partial [Pirellulaceae bacterium]|nr:SDR family NAD(P)-dependent oxidoreductase [Pirellulaceae bacterium]
MAIVTGSSRGIGKAIALGLAAEGCHVAICARGEEALRQAAAEIEARGVRVSSHHLDMSQLDSVRGFAGAALEEFGRIDILINNAGILRDRSLVKMQPEDWEAVLAVHLDAAYAVTKPAFVRMKEQGFGRIVMTTSAAGLFGNFGQTNYSAAKLGLVGF